MSGTVAIHPTERPLQQLCEQGPFGGVVVTGLLGYEPGTYLA